MEEIYKKRESDESSEDADEVIIIPAHRAMARLHNCCVFDPPPCSADRFASMRKKVWEFFGNMYKSWKKMTNNPYQYELFKSILWFTVGLKLFMDVAHYAKLSPMFNPKEDKGATVAAACAPKVEKVKKVC